MLEQNKKEKKKNNKICANLKKKGNLTLGQVNNQIHSLVRLTLTKIEKLKDSQNTNL